MASFQVQLFRTTQKMVSLTIENTNVSLEKVKENIDAIGQVIHPLALLEIDIRLGKDWLENVKHQLDTPNEHMKFDKCAVIVDTCIRNRFKYSCNDHFGVTLYEFRKRKSRKGEHILIMFDEMNIEIKINNVIHSVPLAECDTDTRLDHSELLKEQGNKFFKTGKDDDEALLAYKQALYWVSIVDQNQSKGVRARLRANILANIRKWSQSIVSRPSPSDNSMLSDL